MPLNKSQNLIIISVFGYQARSSVQSGGEAGAQGEVWYEILQVKVWAFYYTKGYWGIFSLRDLPYEVINKLIILMINKMARFQYSAE